MSALPPALRPWEQELGAFDADLVRFVGPWLVRLGLALGPLHAARRLGTEEHHGFSGVARRGPYERLLLSEWALADAVPEEFERRAAMGEHLFLEPDRRDPIGDARSVAIFDCGPDQLGAPRLAHLAIAVALAKRAERAGVPFAIGALQDAEVIPWNGPRTAEQLLRRRTDRRAPDGPARWTDALRAEKTVDRWLVGDRTSGWDGHRVRVEPRDGRLAVQVRGPVSGEVTLELPPSDVAVRCLRDPWRRGVPVAPGRLERAGDLRFSPDERRLLVAQPGGRAVALHVPNSVVQPPGNPKHLYPSSGSRLLAAGWHKRWLWLEDEGQGTVRCYHWKADAYAKFPTDAVGGLVPPAAGHLPAPLLLYAHGLLWTTNGPAPSEIWRWPQPSATPRMLAEQGCALAQSNQGVFAILRIDGQRVACRLQGEPTPLKGGDLGDGPWWGAWWGGGELLFQRDDGRFALRQADGTHRVLDGLAGRPVGLAGDRPVVVADRSVSVVSDRLATPILTFDSPVRDCAVSPYGLVAARSERGAIRVFSTGLGQQVLQVDPP